MLSLYSILLFVPLVCLANDTSPPSTIAPDSAQVSSESSVLQVAAPLSAQDVNGLVKGSVFRLSTLLENANSRSSHGTAFVVDAKGLLLTNYHVVQTKLLSEEKLKLQLEVGTTTIEPKILFVDVVNDLALIKVDMNFPAAVSIAASKSTSEGEVIYSLGFPANDQLTFAQGNYGGEKLMGLINVGFATLPLNRGMSGGPLVNARGEVIGVNRAIITNAQNLSYFSPLSAVHEIIAKAHAENRILASGEALPYKWKYDAVLAIKAQEKVALGSQVVEKRERIGSFSFGLPVPNQSCGQTKLGKEKSESNEDEMYVCQSKSLVPLVENSNGLDVSTMALTYKSTSFVPALTLQTAMDSAYKRERAQILKKNDRKLASLAAPQGEGNEKCNIKNIKNSSGVEINLSYCMLENAFFKGIYSTFVRAEVQEGENNRVAFLQIYKGLSADSTATILEKFFESIKVEKGP